MAYLHTCRYCFSKLGCTCAAFDNHHEPFCARNATICDECFEQEREIEIAAGAEPDPYAAHVKDLSIDQINALIHRNAVPDQIYGVLIRNAS